MTKPTVLFIVGPTASGKSALAVALAKKIDGEILSADSMLVYKGMDIGTAKPTKKERGGILHHGLDLISPTKSFSVFAYRQFALKAIRAMRSFYRHTKLIRQGCGTASMVDMAVC